MISQLLNDPVWSGKIRNAEGIFDGAHGAVVPPELWQVVQATLRGPTGPRLGRRSSRALLAQRLLRCGSCGSSMHIRRLKRDDAYCCGGRRDRTRPECRQRPVTRARIDTAVLDYFAVVNLDIGMIEERRRAHDSKLADLQARIENARRVVAAAERKGNALDARLLRTGVHALRAAARISADGG